MCKPHSTTIPRCLPVWICNYQMEQDNYLQSKSISTNTASVQHWACCHAPYLSWFSSETKLINFKDILLTAKEKCNSQNPASSQATGKKPSSFKKKKKKGQHCVDFYSMQHSARFLSVPGPPLGPPIWMQKPVVRPFLLLNKYENE